MPTYKNTSDQTLNFIGLGDIEPGEIKLASDPIDHPSLQLVDDEEIVEPSTDELQAVEPPVQSAPAPTTPIAHTAQQPPAVAPTDPAPITPPAPTTQPPVDPAVAQQNNAPIQGA